MKNNLTLLLFALFTLSTFHTIHAQATEEGEWVWMAHAKFKPGTAKKAIAIGKKYFSPAYKAAGYELEVFEFLNSEWDLILVMPLKNGIEQYVNMPPKEIFPHLVKLAGGEEEVGALFEEYTNSLAKDRWDLVRRSRN